MVLSAVCLGQSVDTNWVEQYDRVSATHKVEIAIMPDETYLIAQADQYYNIDINGDSLTSFVENTDFGWVRYMLGTDDGVLLAGTHNNKAAVAKMDDSFNIEWTTEFPGNSGEAAALLQDGSDIYAAGLTGYNTDFISKLDTAGDTVWYTEIPQTTFTKLTSIIKLDDGNFLASGNLDDYPLAIKFNSSGDTLWTYFEYLFISFTEMSAFERANGEIVLIGERVVIELDDDGTKLSDTTYARRNFEDIMVDDSYVYLFGSRFEDQYGTDRYPYVEVRDHDMDSISSFKLTDQIHSTAQNTFHGVVETPNGGMLASGKLRDSVNITGNTYNILAALFNDTISSDTTDTIVGISYPSVNQMRAFPNPALERTQLYAVNVLGEINVYDVNGRLMKSIFTNERTYSLDITPFEPGMYFVVSDQGVLRLVKP